MSNDTIEKKKFTFSVWELDNYYVHFIVANFIKHTSNNTYNIECVFSNHDKVDIGSFFQANGVHDSEQKQIIFRVQEECGNLVFTKWISKYRVDMVSI